jgi:PTS system mannose-specific IIC component
VTLEVAALLLLAAWVGADTAAFGQVLVSQPLVAGWLAGALAGDPAAGLAMGVLLQVAYTRIMPLGGVVPEWSGPAAVVGGAVAAWAGSPQSWGALRLPGAVELAAALGVALVVGEAGRRITLGLRHTRAPRINRLLAAADRGDGAGVRRANRLGAVHEAAASAGLVASGLAAGAGVLALVPRGAREDGVWVAAAMLGAGWGLGLRTLVGRRRWETAWLTLFAAAAAWRWLT